MPDVVGALVGHEQPERRRHQLTHVFECAWPERAEERLQFGERLFNGIEVRAVGRKKSQQGSRLLDRGAHRGLFVGGEIVEHNDIARPQRGHQDLLDVGPEGGVVDRPIEHGSGRQGRGAQRRDDGVRLPVAARRVIADAGPPKAASVAA